MAVAFLAFLSADLVRGYLALGGEIGLPTLAEGGWGIAASLIGLVAPYAPSQESPEYVEVPVARPLRQRMESVLPIALDVRRRRIHRPQLVAGARGRLGGRGRGRGPEPAAGCSSGRHWRPVRDAAVRGAGQCFCRPGIRLPGGWLDAAGQSSGAGFLVRGRNAGDCGWVPGGAGSVAGAPAAGAPWWVVRRGGAAPRRRLALPGVAQPAAGLGRAFGPRSAGRDSPRSHANSRAGG